MAFESNFFSSEGVNILLYFFDKLDGFGINDQTFEPKEMI